MLQCLIHPTGHPPSPPPATCQLFFLETKHLTLVHTNPSTDGGREPHAILLRTGTSCATPSQRQSQLQAATLRSQQLRHKGYSSSHGRASQWGALWACGAASRATGDTEPQAWPLWCSSGCLTQGEECGEAARAGTYKAWQRKAGRQACRTGLLGGKRSGAQPQGLKMGQDPHLAAPVGHGAAWAPLLRRVVLLLSTSDSQETEGRGKVGREMAGLHWGELSREAGRPQRVPPRQNRLADRLLHPSVPQFPLPPAGLNSRGAAQAGCPLAVPALAELRYPQAADRTGSTEPQCRIRPEAAPARKP